MTILNKLIKRNTQKTYKFKPEENSIAGFCPDCDCIVSWNSYHKRFECLAFDCCFIANEKGERIWDNSMREENLKKLKEESERNIQVNLN